MERVSNDRQITAVNYAAMAQHGVILLLVGPMVPNLMASFGIGESMAGVLLGLGSLGFMAGPLFAGAVIDRINTRAALLVGLAIELVVLALFGAAPAFAVAIVANFLMHLGSSFVETAANVMPTLRRSRGTAHAVMNLVHMFFSVGAFLGPFLIGLWLEATGNWRPIFFFALVPTAALFVWTLGLRFPRRSGSGASGAVGDGVRAGAFAHLGVVLRSPYAVLGAVTLLLYVGTEVGISSWVVYYLQRELGLAPAASAAGVSVLWVAIMIGRYANSVLGNRFASTTLVTVSGLLGAAGVGVFLFVRTPALAYLVLAWIGLCLSGVFPNVMATLNNRHPERTGTVTAVMAMGAAFGAGFFQWFVGYLAETVSVTAAFVTPAVLQVLLVVTFIAAARAR